MTPIRSNPLYSYSDVLVAIDVLKDKYREYSLNVFIEVVHCIHHYELELTPYEKKEHM